MTTNDILLNFKKADFNPLFYKLKEATTRFVINYGGAGSGKSYTQGQRELRAAMEGKEKILILRKIGSTLNDSVVALIVDELLSNKWKNIQRFWRYNKSERTLTNLVNGSQILFRGLDDPEKIKSIQGITRIWLEEATEFEQRDFDQLNIRIRGKDDLQITLTFNPISDQHWLYNYFFKNTPENVTIIKTTYLDNRFIDKEFINQLNRYADLDYNFYKIYALGDFGSLAKGDEFYKHFKAEKHVKENIEYNFNLPIHLTFDFNVNPYVTCCVWQTEDKKAWQIDEICLTSPNNTTREVCKEFITRYNYHKQPVFIYGDPAGKNEDTRSEKGSNDYKIIMDELKDFHPQSRVEIKAPSISMRGSFMNAIFLQNFDNVELTIKNTCKHTINDYLYVKENPDGSKFKQKVKNKDTGVTSELYGHTSDANDYFITRYFSDSYSLYQNGSLVKKYITQSRQSKIKY